MKFIFGIVSLLIVTFSAPADVPYSDIESAFLKKNAEAVAKMGNDKLLISVLGKESIYSNQQATLVLKDFFTKHPVSTFKFIFKGKENQEGSFAIASYEAKSEKFRFTFHFKKSDANFKIIRLNIEKE